MIILWLGLYLAFLTSLLEAQVQTSEVELGNTVNLKCMPSSERPDIKTDYRWTAPNGIVMSEINKNLIIPNFSYENEGTYTCTATQYINGQSFSNEKSMEVRVKGRSGAATFTVNVPPTYDTFTMGIIYMACKSEDGNKESYRFEWISPSGSVSLGNNYFKDKLTAQDSGRYTCRVTRINDNKMVEVYTNVRVQEIPIVVKTEGSQTIGSTITLNCEVDKEKIKQKVYKTFEYRWMDPSNREISRTNLLTLPLTDVTKFGFYTCQISSEGYRNEQRVEIRSSERIPVNRETSYTATFITNPANIRLSESFELNCQVNPPLAGATYAILFNNQLISNGPRHFIPRVGQDNMGVYECTINGVDQSSRQMVTLKTTFTIKPEYKTQSQIELTTSPGPRITVRIGEKRELHCEVPKNSGLTGRNAEWYFEGRPLNQEVSATYNTNILRMLRVSIAVLKNIQANNQGRYECRIGGEVKEVYIVVLSRARNMEVNPPVENSKVGDNRPVEFHCLAAGYTTKNRDLIWTFRSSSTGQTVDLDLTRWKRSDEITADETSFILLQNVEMRDDGTYICTEPVSRDTARAVLNVVNDVKIVITPPRMKLRIGATATVECSIINGGRSPSDPVFTLSGGRSAGGDSRMTTERLGAGRVQLMFRSVTVNDNGTEFLCRHGNAIERSLLLVDPVCSTGSRLCRNGECISNSRFCDGRVDCADGSDEDAKYCKICDPLSKKCEMFDGKSPTTQFYQVHWTCDGEDDCGNGFDESRCFGNALTCGGLSHRCDGGGKSIPKAFLCDRDRDCPNGDDEDRCLQPTLISEESPSYQRSVKRGETLQLSCQASGYPLPKIIWRYNWGCLTDDMRMVVTDSYRDCSSSVSILTVTNFQPGDDGIYNCEALSGGKRAWSRDYQVLMDFKN